MNIKQQLFLKVTGWNGQMDRSCGFVRIGDEFFNLEVALERVRWLMKIELTDGPRRRTASFSEACMVCGILDDVKGAHSAWVKGYEELIIQ